MNKKPINKNIIRSEVISWIRTILLAVLFALIIKIFVFKTTIVSGQSMYPTLAPNDRIVTEKISLYIKKPKRGDIIIFKSPLDEDQDYIKRIIGVEGDSIHLEDGKFYINGKLLEENYLKINTRTPIGKNFQSSWNINNGKVFVVGDNRSNSIDSRDFGEISMDSIEGKALFRYWPIKEFGAINKNE